MLLTARLAARPWRLYALPPGRRKRLIGKTIAILFLTLLTLVNPTTPSCITNDLQFYHYFLFLSPLRLYGDFIASFPQRSSVLPFFFLCLFWILVSDISTLDGFVSSLRLRLCFSHALSGTSPQTFSTRESLLLAAHLKQGPCKLLFLNTNVGNSLRSPIRCLLLVSFADRRNSRLFHNRIILQIRCSGICTSVLLRYNKIVLFPKAFPG